jgi:hypothetical protein
LPRYSLHTGQRPRSTAGNAGTSARPIDEGDQVAITANIPGADTACGRLDDLPGDVNDEGAVNRRDPTAIRVALHGNRNARSLIVADRRDADAVSVGDPGAGHDAPAARRGTAPISGATGAERASACGGAARERPGSGNGHHDPRV